MLITSIFVGGAFFLLIIIGGYISHTLKELGIEEERLRRAERDLQVTKKQAEIMAQDKSVDDVANDLDRGSF